MYFYTAYRCYGRSLRAANQEQMTLSFRSKAKANERVACKSMKRNPLGNLDNIEWNKEAMEQEVFSYHIIYDTPVNWSDLARRYGIKNIKGNFASKQTKFYVITGMYQWYWQNVLRHVLHQEMLSWCCIHWCIFSELPIAQIGIVLLNLSFSSTT